MPITDRLSIQAAIELLTGKPDLVVVDFRVLRLLMGDLAHLIVLETFDEAKSDRMAEQRAAFEDSFAWDDEPPCT